MFEALVASLPIVVVLALMLVVNWSAGRAALTGLVLALILALVLFPFEPVGGDLALGVFGAFGEAAFTTAAILWIVLPALAIYNLQNETKAVVALRTGLAELSRDPRLTALVVAWFFALLLEGAAGFGTSAALAAPFLVALGMSPTRAVVAAMMGHLVGVTFGAVGTPVVPMVAASDLEPVELSGAIAVQAALVGWAAAVVVAFLVRQAYPDEPVEPVARAVALGLAAGAAFLVPYLLTAVFVGPELPTLAGAIVGGATLALAISQRRSGTPTPASEGRMRDADVTVMQAMAPYLVLVGVVLVTRMVTPLRDVLQDVQLAWDVADGDIGGAFEPLFHPGTMLFIALGAGALVQGATRRQVTTAITASARTIVPVAGALLATLGLARVMVHAGMIDAIAVGAADSVGGGWPLLAPAVGALGTFVTGSATASNVLFSDLQVATASRVEDPVLVTLGAQGFGAALGNAIAPHNIVAAAAIVGLGGRESDILRKTLPMTLALVAAAGVVAFVLTNR